MDQSRRHKYWLEANCLTLVCLLFSFTAFGQVAMRAPGAAVPGDVVVFGPSPNLAVDGGAPTTGNGIATNGGAGVLNVLTNPVVTAYSNSWNGMSGGILFTNDTTLAISSPSNIMQEFFGLGPNVNAELQFVGPLGNYGQLLLLTTHDNPLGRPQDDEFAIEIANNIALIYKNGGVGGSGHLQVGGAGTAGYEYVNVSSNLSINGGSQLNVGSQPWMYLNKFLSNGIVTEWDPTIEAYASPSNNYQFNFDIAHDSGYFGSATAIPDVSKLVTSAAPVGIHMFGGTNGSAMYTGVKLVGRSGTITNGITTLENNNGIGMGAPFWYFSSNGVSPSGQPFFQYIITQDAAWWGASDAGLNFQISADGTGGVTHGFYGSSGFGGFGISKGGLFISSGIGGGAIATNGLLFEVIGPSYLPTNAAPFNVVSNFAPSAGTVYTNLSQSRVLVSGNITVSATSGTDNISINYTNGAVNSAITQAVTAGASTTSISAPFMFPLSPGGTFSITVTGGGSVNNFIWWGL